jgi:3(or 17)beta-hydroxysteroid dehydrogenase
MNRLVSKACVVTGAAAGIGRGIATAFAEEGATVIVADINEEGAHTTAAELSERGFAASSRRHDAGDEGSWRDLMQSVLATHGRLDVLVNNAASGWAADLEHTSGADWDKISRVTGLGTFLGVKLAIEAMDLRGAVINIASIAALRGSFGAGSIAYASVKANVISLTRSAALHCARKGNRIRVNAIAPGLIETDGLRGVLLRAAGGDESRIPAVREQFAKGVPLGFVGEPRDVARAAVYLASEEARYVTGQLIAVDGGITAL